MQEELDMLKTIEESTEKDYMELRRRYNEQVEDAKSMGFANKQLTLCLLTLCLLRCIYLCTLILINYQRTNNGGINFQI